MIKNGYKVTMVTSSNSIMRRVEKKMIDDINVVYIKVPYNQNMGFVRRLFSFTSFMIASTFYSFKTKKVDIVYATSTPLTIGFPALILKLFKGIPYFF